MAQTCLDVTLMHTLALVHVRKFLNSGRIFSKTTNIGPISPLQPLPLWAQQAVCYLSFRENHQGHEAKPHSHSLYGICWISGFRGHFQLCGFPRVWGHFADSSSLLGKVRSSARAPTLCWPLAGDIGSSSKRRLALGREGQVNASGTLKEATDHTWNGRKPSLCPGPWSTHVRNSRFLLWLSRCCMTEHPRGLQEVLPDCAARNRQLRDAQLQGPLPRILSPPVPPCPKLCSFLPASGLYLLRHLLPLCSLCSLINVTWGPTTSWNREDPAAQPHEKSHPPPRL